MTTAIVPLSRKQRLFKCVAMHLRSYAERIVILEDWPELISRQIHHWAYFLVNHFVFRIYDFLYFLANRLDPLPARIIYDQSFDEDLPF